MQYRTHCAHSLVKYIGSICFVDNRRMAMLLCQAVTSLNVYVIAENSALSWKKLLETEVLKKTG